MSAAEIINELYKQREALYRGEINQEALAKIIDFEALKKQSDSKPSDVIDFNNINTPSTITIENDENTIFKIHFMAGTKEETNKQLDNIVPISLSELPSKFITPTEVQIGEAYKEEIEINTEEIKNTYQKTYEYEAA